MQQKIPPWKTKQKISTPLEERERERGQGGEEKLYKREGG